MRDLHSNFQQKNIYLQLPDATTLSIQRNITDNITVFFVLTMKLYWLKKISFWLTGLQINMTLLQTSDGNSDHTFCPVLFHCLSPSRKAWRFGSQLWSNLFFCPNKPGERDWTNELADAHFFTLRCLFTFYYDWDELVGAGKGRYKNTQALKMYGTSILKPDKAV